MVDNSRAFLGYDQWKTTPPDDYLDEEDLVFYNEVDLWAAISEDDTPEEEARQLLKGLARENTSFGVWLEFEEERIAVGCIVEGAEDDVIPVYLRWPFTLQEYYDVLEAVNHEAERLFWESSFEDRSDNREKRGVAIKLTKREESMLRWMKRSYEDMADLGFTVCECDPSVGVTCFPCSFLQAIREYDPDYLKGESVPKFTRGTRYDLKGE